MKNKLFHIILITLFGFILQSCKKETEQENLSETEIQKPKDSVESVSVEKPEKDIQYSIEVEKIDSLEYRHFAIKNNINKKKLTKITDFKEAKKLLKGVVEFDENPDYGENPLVKKYTLEMEKLWVMVSSIFILLLPIILKKTFCSAKADIQPTSVLI